MIIGITGMAEDPQGNRSILGAGKDAAADFLVSDHGFVKVSLADEMKRTARRWFPAFTVEHLWGPSEMRSEPVEVAPGVTLTARHVLQQMGTEVGRCIWEDTWVHYTLSIAQKLLDAEGEAEYIREEGLYWHDDTRDSAEADRRYERRPLGVVIPDVRFPNEMARIQSRGKVVRVWRPVEWVRAAETNHASERGVLAFENDRFDYILENSNTLEDLRNEVGRMMNSIQK